MEKNKKTASKADDNCPMRYFYAREENCYVIAMFFNFAPKIKQPCRLKTRMFAVFSLVETRGIEPLTS
ncbi:MAG: hypothetical protein J6F33_04960 [Acidaminococcaceae bacterium]|nr:hypothetical protein [Acidaminococcaceae bacterium]